MFGVWPWAILKAGQRRTVGRPRRERTGGGSAPQVGVGWRPRERAQGPEGQGERRAGGHDCRGLSGPEVSAQAEGHRQGKGLPEGQFYPRALWRRGRRLSRLPVLDNAKRCCRALWSWEGPGRVLRGGRMVRGVAVMARAGLRVRGCGL